MILIGHVEEQMISHVLHDGNIDFWTKNGIDERHFRFFPQTYKWIVDFYNKYGKTPTPDTLLMAQNSFEPTKDIYDGSESNENEMKLFEELDPDSAIVEYAEDQRVFHKMLGEVNVEMNRLNLTEGSVAAIEYAHDAMGNILRERDNRDTVLINRNAFKRYESYMDRVNSDEPYTFGTGFEELDSITGGLRKGEELAVIYARTGNCKTWILNKMLQYNYHIGRNVGIFSPEMSEESLGYRIDTLEANFDNHALTTGRRMTEDEMERYKEYALSMSSKNANNFAFCKPSTFNNKPTVSKLRRWVQENNVEILGIDGISYMTDERYMKGDSRTTQLTHIAEDLMTMSIELKIPIVVVAQANRTGVSENTPELDSIRDSDGISHNATLAISSKMTDTILTLKITKNRYGKVGDKVKYRFNVNNGVFEANPLDASEEFDDLGVRDRGVKNKQPLERQGSTLHPF